MHYFKLNYHSFFFLEGEGKEGGGTKLILMLETNITNVCN